MNLQQLIPLSDVYSSEEEFSDDLADNLDALNVGTFEDVRERSQLSERAKQTSLLSAKMAASSSKTSWQRRIGITGADLKPTPD